MKPHEEWIGVDLDSTLARWDGFQGLNHIGPPIPAMVERVRKWLGEGREVRIMTARVAQSIYRPTSESIWETVNAIEAWCLEHIGVKLKVTCIKDAGMAELWDDRAVQVVPNTGQPLLGLLRRCDEMLDLLSTSSRMPFDLLQKLEADLDKVLRAPR